jgi:Bax protein
MTFKFRNISLVFITFFIFSSCESQTKEEIEEAIVEAKADAEAEAKEQKNVGALPKEPFKFSKTEVKGKYKASPVPKVMTVQQKKKRFKALLVAPIQKVYSELQERFIKVSAWLKEGTHAQEIASLKEEYKAESDHELLAALKPHPPSIVLAQAAMESAWATSRFFVKAKNVFGVWSFDENEPRIAAGEQRGKKTIWLKKYSTIEDAVRDNYRVLARGHAHQHFRDARLKTDNPYKLVKKLDRYSEIGHKYGEELASMIRYNKFTEYDPVY